ncbi:MAG: peptidase S16 [Proteobacteria bacterium]|nr:peptidase S16 [Pseudomonadota bacterium]
MIEDVHELPLFPLRTVLFPGGLLALRVFEARYMDLVTRCLKTGEEFGVVLILDGNEVHEPGTTVRLAAVGCRARVLDVDMQQPGLLQVRCKGGGRFMLHSHAQGALGLQTGRIQATVDDLPAVLDARHVAAAMALGRAIAALDAQGQKPFLPPYRLDLPGWVANRWAEVLPIGQLARQRLMELPDGTQRLDVVQRYLRQHGILDGAHALQ